MSQIDINTRKVIKIYNSISEASRAIGKKFVNNGIIKIGENFYY